MLYDIFVSSMEKQRGPYQRRLLETIDIVSIDVDVYDADNAGAGFSFYGESLREAIRTGWIMIKASPPDRRYALPPIQAERLGDSDFRVPDVPLHKGPMRMNAIGPKVDLNPGSVSAAVDRFYKKGLVSRVESESDCRVRTVSLAEKGRRVLVPIFREHAALTKRAFQDVSPEEQRQMEEDLERIGRHAKNWANK